MQRGPGKALQKKLGDQKNGCLCCAPGVLFSSIRICKVISVKRFDDDGT